MPITPIRGPFCTPVHSCDSNTVTHIFGLRAFGTKLICEQVIGRALRRLSYEPDPESGLFGVEYADIMGIDGLNFSAQPRSVRGRGMPSRSRAQGGSG